MELTYENVSKFFDKYFETVNEYMGPIEKVPIIGRLFSEDQIVSDSKGNLGKPFDYSAHYYFIPAEDTGFKIRKIEDFAGYQSQEDIEPHLEAFGSSSKQAISKLVSDWLKSEY